MLLSALGIIMVVDAHCWGSLNLFTSFFPYNSFFMPMFVFISGYFNKVNADTKLGEYIKRKFVRLMVPCFCFTFVLFWVDWVINGIKTGSLPQISVSGLILVVLRIFVSGEAVEIASPLWFVPALFFTELFYACLKKVFFKRWNSPVMLAIFFAFHIAVVWYARNIGAFPTNVLLLKAIFFMPFMELGIFYRDVLEEKLRRLNSFLLLAVLLAINMVRIMIVPVPYDIAFNSIASLNGFTSPYIVTPMISSIIGILFWLTLVDLLGKPLYENRLINYISDNTFWIMSIHLALFNVLNCILLLINTHIPIKGFNPDVFRLTAWYRWEAYPIFRYAYFAFGLFGSLGVKYIWDRVWRNTRERWRKGRKETSSTE